MANEFARSRSPVRAINTVNPSWGNSVPQRRSWSEPLANELPAPANHPAAAVDDGLCCPDCGSVLRLSLTPWGGEIRPSRPSGLSPLTLQPAPAAPETASFEDSIRRHKRELIATALEQNGGVMTRAAKALGLKYTTFVAMVHRLGLPQVGEEVAAE